MKRRILTFLTCSTALALLTAFGAAQAKADDIDDAIARSGPGTDITATIHHVALPGRGPAVTNAATIPPISLTALTFGAIDPNLPCYNCVPNAALSIGLWPALDVFTAGSTVGVFLQYWDASYTGTEYFTIVVLQGKTVIQKFTAQLSVYSDSFGGASTSITAPTTAGTYSIEVIATTTTKASSKLVSTLYVQ